MKCGIVVGHNEKAQGSYSKFLESSEFNFWSEVAERLRSGDTDVFYRSDRMSYHSQIKDVYNRADKKGCDFTIELHFNSFTPLSHGCETLTSGSSKSRILAAICQDEFKSYWHDRGVKRRRKWQRGGYSLHAGKAPAVLIEPFFGSNKSDVLALGSNPVSFMVDRLYRIVNRYKRIN